MVPYRGIQEHKQCLGLLIQNQINSCSHLGHARTALDCLLCIMLEMTRRPPQCSLGMFPYRWSWFPKCLVAQLLLLQHMQLHWSYLVLFLIKIYFCPSSIWFYSLLAQVIPYGLFSNSFFYFYIVTDTFSSIDTKRCDHGRLVALEYMNNGHLLVNSMKVQLCSSGFLCVCPGYVTDSCLWP